MQEQLDMVKKRSKKFFFVYKNLFLSNGVDSEDLFQECYLFIHQVLKKYPAVQGEHRNKLIQKTTTWALNNIYNKYINKYIKPVQSNSPILTDCPIVLSCNKKPIEDFKALKGLKGRNLAFGIWYKLVLSHPTNPSVKLVHLYLYKLPIIHKMFILVHYRLLNKPVQSNSPILTDCPIVLSCIILNIINKPNSSFQSVKEGIATKTKKILFPSEILLQENDQPIKTSSFNPKNIKKILALLSESENRIVNFRIYDNMNFSQIGQIEKISKQRVARIFNRAIIKIRLIIQVYKNGGLYD